MQAHILISGPMGVGKSTTAAALAEVLDLPLYLESSGDKNPYLEKFYEDMSRWALSSQTFFICEALTQQQTIHKSQKGAIQDRSVWEHLAIFASSLYRAGHLTGADIALLEQIIHIGMHNISPPDLMLYLQGSYDDIVQRIEARGREYEANIDQTYLEDHIAAYNSWIKNFSLCPVMTVNTKDFNPHKDDDVKELAKQIKRKLK